MSELRRLTKRVNKNKLTQVTSPPLVIESDVFVNNTLVKVFSQVPRYPFAHSVKNCPSETDTNSCKLKINNYHKYLRQRDQTSKYKACIFRDTSLLKVDQLQYQ